MNPDRATPTHGDAPPNGETVDSDVNDRYESDGGDDRWLILNPASGDGGHGDRVHRLAADRGIRVLETEGEGDAAAFARRAVAENVGELAVCGGDGTLQEVLSGLHATGAIRSGTETAIERMHAVHGATDGTETTDDAVETLAPNETGGANGTNGTDEANGELSEGSSVTDPPVLCVIPAGTANIFATDMGITDIDGGFSVLDGGEVRRLDVGLADDEPFMKSCIAGLTADTSSATSDELKERFGSLAFVITGVKRAADFDPLDVEVDARGAEGEWSWNGEALCIVVGNARRYAGEVGQANIEDGLLDVTIVEEMPPGDVVAEAIERQLLGRETENVTGLRARRIEIDATGEGPIEFSLDGEIASHERLTLTVRERAVPVRVGPTYDPDPSDA